MAIYSTLLAAGNVDDGSLQDIYTAPALNTVVVRDIEIVQSSAYYGPCRVRVLSGSALSFIYVVTPTTVGQSYHWEGRAVLLPADVLQAESINGGFWYRISGYVLGG